jgi:hypothetical protein
MRFEYAVCMTFLVAGAISAGPSEQRTSPGLGAVEGRVVDTQTERPVPGARVILEPDDAPASGKLMSVLSDAQGNFYANDVSPGKYVVPAAKEDENYPNADHAAFAADLTALPRVLVREGEVTRGVVIRMEKGGKLLGLVLDAQTRQPMVASRIRLTRIDDPRLWIEAGPDETGHFQFVVPTRPFRLVVSAPGYRTWNFRGGGEGQSEVLLLKPESIQNVPVMLEKMN